MGKVCAFLIMVLLLSRHLVLHLLSTILSMFLRFHPTSYLFINLQKTMTVSLCLILLDSPFRIEHRGISFSVGRVAMDSILSMASSILPILLDPQYILVQNSLPLSGKRVLVILLHLFFIKLLRNLGRLYQGP